MLSGWLSPTGEYHMCPYWGHIDLAYEILNKQYGYRHFYENTPDEDLIQRGWIKLYKSMFSPEQQIYYNFDRPIATEGQKIFLKADYEKNPDDWGKVGKIELKELRVLDEEYDENGCLI